MNEMIIMEGVREYGEKYLVELGTSDSGRLTIVGTNEGGYNSTEVDLLDVIEWVKNNMPELLNETS